LPAASQSHPSLGRITLRALTLVVGLLGLGWAVSNFASSEAADVFWDLEAHLLKFETYKRTAATGILTSAAAQELSPCDNHSQRALLLLEIPLADLALRSGSTREFDAHMRSLEARTHEVLKCAPRDALVWLVAFALQIEHGILDERTFDLLAMSFETSPDEAWIGIRRIVVATPVIQSAPEPIQRRILAEFQNLIRHGFIEQPARAYLNATQPTRSLLQTQIDGLKPREQRAFSDALESIRS
jgi:hypothetical protein